MHGGQGPGPTIDDDIRAGHVGGAIRSEENDQRRDLLGGGEPPLGMPPIPATMRARASSALVPEALATPETQRFGDGGGMSCSRGASVRKLAARRFGSAGASPIR
jgi:hypothetical protein